MAMGIVSDSEFERDIKDCLIPSTTDNKPIIPTVEIIDIHRGRGEGNVAVPDSLRKIIGETNELNGRAEAIELGRNFGISPSSVSAYANGSKSTATYDERPNQNHIDGAKERISKRARHKLSLALKHITEDKLESAKPRDLAGIAKDMSAVIKNMEPEKESEGSNKTGPTFVFYSPQFKSETAYDVIQAKE